MLVHPAITSSSNHRLKSSFQKFLKANKPNKWDGRPPSSSHKTRKWDAIYTEDSIDHYSLNEYDDSSDDSYLFVLNCKPLARESMFVTGQSWIQLTIRMLYKWNDWKRTFIILTWFTNDGEWILCPRDYNDTRVTYTRHPDASAVMSQNILRVPLINNYYYWSGTSCTPSNSLSHQSLSLTKDNFRMRAHKLLKLITSNDFI